MICREKKVVYRVDFHVADEVVDLLTSFGVMEDVIARSSDNSFSAVMFIDLICYELTIE